MDAQGDMPASWRYACSSKSRHGSGDVSGEHSRLRGVAAFASGGALEIGASCVGVRWGVRCGVGCARTWAVGERHAGALFGVCGDPSEPRLGGLITGALVRSGRRGRFSSGVSLRPFGRRIQPDVVVMGQQLISSACYETPGERYLYNRTSVHARQNVHNYATRTDVASASRYINALVGVYNT